MPRLFKWFRSLRATHQLLFVTAGLLGLLLLPLALDLFLAIPWNARKLLGKIAAPAAIAAVAFWSIDRGSFRPVKPLSQPADYTGLVLAVITASLAVPLCRQPDAVGAFYDWDQFLSKYEAVRQIIVKFHQFPWWNPWRRGGFPLAADPETGVLSPATGFVLLLGTSIGLRVAGVCYLMIAVEGARRLGKLLFQDRCAATTVGAIYGLNGVVICYLVGGLYIPMSLGALPWLLYHLFQLHEGTRHGLGLGFWLAFALLSGIQYPSIYALMITGLLWGVVLLKGSHRPSYLRHSLLAIGTVFCLAGWRIVSLASLIIDYPRALAVDREVSLTTLLSQLVIRPDAATLMAQTESRYFPWHESPWEGIYYLGPVAMLLFLISVCRGWRWWHSFALVCFWCSIGVNRWYHLSYWVNQWPLASALGQVGRWRVPAALGVALAVASVVVWLRSSPRSWTRALGFLVPVVITADYVLCGYQVLPVAFTPAQQRYYPGTATGSIVNIESAMRHIGDRQSQTMMAFPCTENGYGVVRAHEAMLTDWNAPTARLWRDHPDYVAEAWTGTTPVLPVFWSPNKIVFQVEPGQTIQINQNPGSWWTVNGARPFSAMRCVEPLERFEVVADSEGEIVLEIHPRWLGFGILLTAAGALVAGVTGVTGGCPWRLNHKSSEGSAPALDA